jgi:maltose O-acetyltransferase
VKALLRIFFNRFGRYATQFRAAWNRRWFLFTEKPRHRKIDLGRDVIFFVPVKSGGQGTLLIGDGNKFGYPLAFHLGNGRIQLQARTPDAEIVIGENNWFNNNVSLYALQSVRIGNNCLVGELVSIMDADFHEIEPATRNRSAGVVKPVVIGNNVWIGNRTMILKGAKIGDNSVIGTMSLVTGEIPANCIAAGVPTKVIRPISS